MILQSIKLADVFPNWNCAPMSDKLLKQLIDSIIKYGLKNPIAVIQRGEVYIVFDGYNRCRALKKLGEKEVHATVLTVEEYKSMAVGPNPII